MISRRIEVSSCGSKPAKSDEMFANGVQIYYFIIGLPLRGWGFPRETRVGAESLGSSEGQDCNTWRYYDRRYNIRTDSDSETLVWREMREHLWVLETKLKWKKRLKQIYWKNSNLNICKNQDLGLKTESPMLRIACSTLASQALSGICWSIRKERSYSCRRIENIAKGTTDPRVEFCLPK